MTQDQPTVGLLVTCLVDSIRPEIGFATLKLLEDAGCRVSVPETQTCCGQPGLNSGAADESKPLAKAVIKAFRSFDYVVAPSGSCLGTVKTHYPELFKDEPEWLAVYARAVSALEAGDLDGARQAFVETDGIRGSDGDGPARFFLKLLDQGETMNGGVYDMTEK